MTDKVCVMIVLLLLFIMYIVYRAPVCSEKLCRISFTFLVVNCGNLVHSVKFRVQSLLVWPDGVTVMTLACDSRGREFNSRPFAVR